MAKFLQVVGLILLIIFLVSMGYLISQDDGGQMFQKYGLRVVTCGSIGIFCLLVGIATSPETRRHHQSRP